MSFLRFGASMQGTCRAAFGAHLTHNGAIISHIYAKSSNWAPSVVHNGTIGRNSACHSSLLPMGHASSCWKSPTIRYYSSTSTTCFDTIILRDEVKDHEKRTPLLPEQVALLKQHGYRVLVEYSETRCFSNEEYQKAGAEIVPGNSYWLAESEARSNEKSIVLGLKELPQEGEEIPLLGANDPLCSASERTMANSYPPSIQVPNAIYGNHIFFAHIFKKQRGWIKEMQRFERGNGMLMDLEFLTDDSKQRVAAFGGAAGYAGMAVGLLAWVRQQKALQEQPNTTHEDQDWHVTPYPSRKDLVAEIEEKIKELNKTPRIIIVGAAGRCGQGSTDCLKDVFGEGYDKVQYWGRQETEPSSNPQEKLVEADIVVNDIFAAGDMDPFITMDFIRNASDRNFSVFVDVSCDISSHKKAFPLNDHLTTFKRPSRRVLSQDDNEAKLPLDVIAIDNLPTLIPAFSSRNFANELIEHLLELKNVNMNNSSSDTENTTEKQRVWLRAKELFERKKQKALSSAEAQESK